LPKLYKETQLKLKQINKIPTKESQIQMQRDLVKVVENNED